MPTDDQPAVTPLDFARWKAEGRRIAVLTAYDFTTARLLDAAGVDGLLVGDPLGTVVHGHARGGGRGRRRGGGRAPRDGQGPRPGVRGVAPPPPRLARPLGGLPPPVRPPLRRARRRHPPRRRRLRRRRPLGRLPQRGGEL